MEGWELDGSIYPVAREYMGLQQLEESGALVSPKTCKAQMLLSREGSDWLDVLWPAPCEVCVNICIEICIACLL